MQDLEILNSLAKENVPLINNHLPVGVDLAKYTIEAFSYSLKTKKFSTRSYTRDKFINIRHGYAISVHKSQGSEFPMVIMPIVNNYNRMLYNKLIYTAVTRAKKSLMIVGDPQCFINGIKNDYVDNRKTSLKEMIVNKYNY